jgi:hypothetical protein
MEQVLIEVTSLLVDRARSQLEREIQSGTDESAVNELRRLHELEKELRAIRHEFGLADAGTPAPSPPGRQVSRFYEVPGQEDA